jgi:hypothetical protein
VSSASTLLPAEPVPLPGGTTHAAPVSALEPVPVEPVPERAVAGGLWESAGLWALFLVLGIAWLAGSLWILERQQSQDLQQQRLALTVVELKEALEGDLALGLDLVGHPQAQGLIDNALQRDRELRSIDIAGVDGATLFSTDRGAVGEPLAPSVWAEARRGGDAHRIWNAEVAGEPLIGSGLRGPFGEPVGYVVSAYRTEATPWPSLRSWGFLALAALATLLAGFGLARRALRRTLPEEAPVARSLATAQATRQRLEACLGQIDEHEAAE